MENQTTQSNNVSESKIRKVIFNEFSLAVAGVSLVVATIGWVQSPQKESDKAVEVLRAQVVQQQQDSKGDKALFDQLLKTQQNDLHTVEEAIKAQNDSIKRLENQVIKVQTILEERLPIRK